jgi:hypothetical protein
MSAITDTPVPVSADAKIRALLERHGLSASPVAVTFFSFTDTVSFIGAHDPDGRITRLIEFLPLPVRGADLLDAIAAIDENAPRLVANYLAAFPDIAARLADFGAGQEPATDASLRWLLSACSLALWLEDRDVALALGQPARAVQVDTAVIERDGRYLLDGRRLLRSVMSYRIAEVPKYVLARSVFESLGDFAGDAMRRLIRDWKADAVVCAGDLFAYNKILRDRARASTLRLRVPSYFPPAADG